jgi:hypothetical protein
MRLVRSAVWVIGMAWLRALDRAVPSARSARMCAEHFSQQVKSIGPPKVNFHVQSTGATAAGSARRTYPRSVRRSSANTSLAPVMRCGAKVDPLRGPENTRRCRVNSFTELCSNPRILHLKEFNVAEIRTAAILLFLLRRRSTERQLLSLIEPDRRSRAHFCIDGMQQGARGRIE